MYQHIKTVHFDHVMCVVIILATNSDYLPEQRFFSNVTPFCVRHKVKVLV
jgi:hypothetical protein